MKAAKGVLPRKPRGALNSQKPTEEDASKARDNGSHINSFRANDSLIASAHAAVLAEE